MVVLTFVVITIVDIAAESMARNIATLLLVFAYGSCMEMRETVERMVMVRTTGSDLQPAATGYIYKKKSDGPASVTKMGETEVIEHFTKLYKEPEAYKAPVHANKGPFHEKEEDDVKSASHASEEIVKPVVEVEHDDDPIDGIADEDRKIIEEYAKAFGNYKDNFADYLHGVGYFDHGIYHGYGGGKNYGAKGYDGYGEKDHEGLGEHHHFEKGQAGKYHTQKHGGYSVSKEGGNNHGYDETDDHGTHYGQRFGFKGDDHGHRSSDKKGEALEGFHKVFDKDEYKKDHDFYDGDALKGGHHKYASGHDFHKSDAGKHDKGSSHASGHHSGDFEKGGYVAKESKDEHDSGHSSEESGESGHQKHRGFGVKAERNDDKSYEFKIKH